MPLIWDGMTLIWQHVYFLKRWPNLAMGGLVDINSLMPNDAYMRQYNIPTIVQIMACRLFGTKPLSEPMLPYCQLDPNEHILVKFYQDFKSFHLRKCTWNSRLRNGVHFFSCLDVLSQQWYDPNILCWSHKIHNRSRPYLVCSKCFVSALFAKLGTPGFARSNKTLSQITSDSAHKHTD